MASGMIGGLPVTQVVVRTSANVNSGGISKLSAIIHGLLIAVATLTFPKVFSYVPYASLAAILILVGYKLAKPKLFIGIWKANKKEFIMFAVTIIAILFSDLLIGIMIGMLVSFIIIFVESNVAKRPSFFKKAFHVKKSENVYEIEFKEQVSFLSKAPIAKILNKISANSNLIINKSKVVYFSSDVEELINDFKSKAEELKVTITVIERNN
jgi:MFS superfamily sulfate permease-like transporter